MANLKILIVEDEKPLAQEIYKLLIKFGYDVVGISETGDDAINKASTFHPELVLLKEELRGDMSAVETASILKFKHGIATVFLSSHSDKETLKRISKAEPFGYLLKPFEERALYTTIEMAFFRQELEKRHSEKETWYETTLRSIGEAVIATDYLGKIKFMNSVAENLTGWKIHDAIGVELSRVFRTKAQHNKPYTTNFLENILKNKITAILKNHATLILKDGREISIEENASPIKDIYGNTVGVVLVFQDVSERFKAQDALKASQDYAQSIVNSSLDMIITVDKNRNIVEFNNAAENCFGYSKKEVIGRHVSMLYANPEDGKNIHITTIEKGRYIKEVVNKRKNGECFNCLLSSSVLLNTKGEEIGVMGISRDITEKINSEKALKESEERYRTLVELSPDPIIVHNNDSIVFVNSSAVEVFGAKTSDELIGKSFLEMVHQDFREEEKLRIVDMISENKEVPVIEIIFYRIDGTIFYAEISSASFIWQGKKAVQVILRDVTERIRSEKVIRGSEEKYRTLFENVLDGVYQTTPDGEILTANPALARMLGYESETDLLLLNVENDLYVDADERRNFLKRLYKGENIKNAEFKMRKKDGSIITVLENARIVRSKIGDILYYEGTITDITELKLTQDALQKSEERCRVFIEQNVDATWCFEPYEPISIHISEDRQIKYLMEKSYLKEYNQATLNIYNINKSNESIKTIKLKDILPPISNENIELLRCFIKSNYNLISQESKKSDKDGNTKYFVNNLIGVIKDDKIVRVWGTQKDITKEKLALENTESERTIFKSIAENSSIANCIFKKEKILYINKAMENLCGYTQIEIASLHPQNIFNPKLFLKLKNNKLQRLEVEIIDKNKNIHIVDANITPISYKSSSALLLSCYDITNFKKNSFIDNAINMITEAPLIAKTEKEVYKRIYKTIKQIQCIDNLYITAFNNENKKLEWLYLSDVKITPKQKNILLSQMKNVFISGKTTEISDKNSFKKIGVLSFPLKFKNKNIGVIVITLSFSKKNYLSNTKDVVSKIIPAISKAIYFLRLKNKACVIR